MRSGYTSGKAFVVTKNRARGMRTVLRWIKRDAPRKRERLTASQLLMELEGVEDQKQIFLSRDQAEMYLFILTEFPSSAESERQLSLFDQGPTTVLDASSIHPVSKPVLRTDLTEEEQAEREQTVGHPRYIPKSDAYHTNKLIARSNED